MKDEEIRDSLLDVEMIGGAISSAIAMVIVFALVCFFMVQMGVSV